MRPRRSLRSAFVVTVGATSALLASCGGGTNGEAPDGGDAARCPATLPSDGESCSIHGECDYVYDPNCPRASALCGVAGVWRISSAYACPIVTPVEGSPCCVPQFACGYEGPELCFGTPLPENASCVAGKWKIVLGSCNPPPPMDAGPALDARANDAAGD
jgi:hypothetical protein